MTRVDADGDGDFDTSASIHHDVNNANELQQVIEDGVPTAMLHDAAGNLTSDGAAIGDFVYQYDGLNRLIQVDARGSAVVDAEGRITGGALGGMVFRYTYDGLGRIIRKELPESPSNPELRIESYFHDGVRRIQDVIHRPVAAPPPPPCDEEPLTKGGGEEEWKDEDGVSKGEELPPCNKGEPQTTVTTTTYESWTDRAYVYGPGDVNELVCQIDANDNPLYVLQDANLNVMGLLGESAPDAWGLVRQDMYAPYGEIQATDLYDPSAPDNKVGFQGMFADRLSSSAQDATLVPNGAVLYRTPNRSYHPTLGRWLQRDPNATGQLTLDTSADSGETLIVASPIVNIEDQYIDGLNPFGFVRSNPIIGQDPLGLTLVVRRDWDEIYESIAGKANAYLGVQGAASFGGFYGAGVNVAVLPDGAIRAAALSQGISAFADQYAQQVIELPFELSLGGLLSYAETTYVEVGRKVLHHTIPNQVLNVIRPEVRRALLSIKGPRQVIWSISEGLHKMLHSGLGSGYRSSGGAFSPRGGGWNATWRAALHALGRNFRLLEAEDLLRIRDEIVDLFDIGNFRPH